MAITEYRGVRDLVYAEVTADTADAYTTGTVKSLAGVAEISKTTDGGSEAHYYDNKAAVVISVAGADTITCSVSAIPLDVLAEITGQTYSTATGMLVEGQRQDKVFALGYKTKKTDGSEVYVWRLKGVFAVPDQTNATEDDGTEANGQELTYTGIETVHEFTLTGRGAKAIAVLADGPAAVDNFFDSVQTPDTVTTE